MAENRVNLAAIAVSNGLLLFGLYALGWAPATMAFLCQRAGISLSS